jgi:hypothetical protein
MNVHVFSSTPPTTCPCPVAQSPSPVAPTTTPPLSLPVAQSPAPTTCGNNGPIHYLAATKDVWLESGNNKNQHNFLIVGKHVLYPKKRSLLQFEDIPSTCNRIAWAKMYLRYWYSHWVKSEPAIPRTFQVNQVKQEWKETQATNIYRMSGKKWNKPLLALDGTDADGNSTDSVVFPPITRWVEFDITEVARNWKSGQPNYGVLFWATNENEDGRDIRFFSRERSTDKPHVLVFCN